MSTAIEMAISGFKEVKTAFKYDGRSVISDEAAATLVLAAATAHQAEQTKTLAGAVDDFAHEYARLSK